MQKKPILKIIGWCMGIHLFLVLLTILEVLVYSTLINPHHVIGIYEHHAEISGSIISIVVGFILIYFIASKMMANLTSQRAFIGYGLPVAYIIVDLLFLILSGAFFKGRFFVFGISYATKILAGHLAMGNVKNKLNSRTDQT